MSAGVAGLCFLPSKLQFHTSSIVPVLTANPSRRWRFYRVRHISMVRLVPCKGEGQRGKMV